MQRSNSNSSNGSTSNDSSSDSRASDADWKEVTAMVDETSEDEIRQLTRNLRDANAEVDEALSEIGEWRDLNRTLQKENDGLRLSVQQSVESQQASNMTIHLLTVYAELQRVRSDCAMGESRAALAAVTADRDALRMNIKELHDRTQP